MVTIKEGPGWIIDGHFKLVHLIRLDEFEDLLNKMTLAVQAVIKQPEKKIVARHHLTQLHERIDMLKGKMHRRQRSINWIGSAWKWLAGNPDAADWDEVLKNENNIIENNNHQYKINERILRITKDITQRINQVINSTVIQTSSSNRAIHEQNVMDELLVVKEDVNEIVRACQMARSGIVNTNLLDHEEINRLISEVETLPYANVVEALQFGKPSVYTNDSILLYVLSMPKVSRTEYNLLLTRASILGGKQVDLPYSKILANHEDTYGIISNCLSMGNMTTCDESSLEKLEEEGCVVRLLKGGHANCAIRTNTASITELIKEDTIFVTNFQGKLYSKNISKDLSGTYLIQLYNESIRLNNRTFVSLTATSLQALPPVLTNTSLKVNKVDIEYLHDMSIKNIKILNGLSYRLNTYTATDVTILLILAIVVWMIWRKLHRKIDLPKIQILPPPVLPTPNISS